MILSDKDILLSIKNKEILISPFDQCNLGANSYDVHLSKYLAIYKREVLDARIHNEINHFEIPEEGYVIHPGSLYLGSTLEYTESHKHVPFLDGKSSTGRLGIDIHATAGKGDVGFCNHWTLEISCIHPVRIYAGMPIGQLIYHSVTSEPDQKYNKRGQSKYNQIDPRPKESMMFKNKF